MERSISHPCQTALSFIIDRHPRDSIVEIRFYISPQKNKISPPFLSATSHNIREILSSIFTGQRTHWGSTAWNFHLRAAGGRNIEHLAAHPLLYNLKEASTNGESANQLSTPTSDETWGGRMLKNEQTDIGQLGLFQQINQVQETMSIDTTWNES